MPVTVPLGGPKLVVAAAPLTADAFAPFGAVVENPRPDLHPSRHPAVAVAAAAAAAVAGASAAAAAAAAAGPPLPFDAVSANQGSAIKYQHVTRMLNLYDQAPSRAPGVAVMNLFVCAARKLRPRPARAAPASSAGAGGQPAFFCVDILERHPFTTQTFAPLASHPAGAPARYLVVVAPSLPPSDADAHLPVPGPSRTSSALSSPQQQRPLPGRGLPDLRGLRAFVATSGQAVTYGAGTWHAPMVALGPEGSMLDFVVVQFANGQGAEDCQEAVLAPSPSSSPSSSASGGVWVQVPEVPQEPKRSRL